MLSIIIDVQCMQWLFSRGHADWRGVVGLLQLCKVVARQMPCKGRNLVDGDIRCFDLRPRAVPATASFKVKYGFKLEAIKRLRVIAGAGTIQRCVLERSLCGRGDRNRCDKANERRAKHADIGKHFGRESRCGYDQKKLKWLNDSREGATKELLDVVVVDKPHVGVSLILFEGNCK